MFGFRDARRCPADVGVSVAVTFDVSRSGCLGSTGRGVPGQCRARRIPGGTRLPSGGAPFVGPPFLTTARESGSLRGTSNATQRSSVATRMPTFVVRP
jgi:hypothetical protein